MQRRILLLGIMLAGSALAGCSHSPPHAVKPAEPRLTFGYDRSQPLGYIDRGVVARIGSGAVHDVGYLSRGERVNGYLLEPKRRERRPGIVLVHGSGGDRRELLGAAAALARRGIVAMTITAPSAARARARAATAPARLAQIRTAQVEDVIAVRRAADLLGSLSTVDRRRLGYLGWSSGAKTGAFLAASDRRFKALALLSAGAAKLAAFVAAAPASLRPLVERELGDVDPLRYIASARPGTLLLEDGTGDTVIPHQALLNVIRVSPNRTVVRWYRAGHALNAAAYRYAFTWLEEKLGAT